MKYSNADYSISDSTTTTNFPYFPNTNLSLLSSTSATISQQANDDFNKSFTVGHFWTQNNMDIGNTDIVANPTYSSHQVSLSAANIPSHKQEIKEEYDAQ